MSNMGYCRFQNTLQDLTECAEYIGDRLESEEEEDARLQLVNLCKYIHETFNCID